MGRAINYPEEASALKYAPGTQFDLCFKFVTAQYDLSTKWIRFRARLSPTGEDLFVTTEDTGSYITVSVSGTDNLATLALPFDATNDISGGGNWDNCVSDHKNIEWALEFGSDSDASLIEWRVQGEVTILSDAGNIPS